MSGARGIIYSMSEAFYDSQRHHFQEHQFYYQQHKEATLTTAMVPYSGALVLLSAVQRGNIDHTNGTIYSKAEHFTTATGGDIISRRQMQKTDEVSLTNRKYRRVLLLSCALERKTYVRLENNKKDQSRWRQVAFSGALVPLSAVQRGNIDHSNGTIYSKAELFTTATGGDIISRRQMHLLEQKCSYYQQYLEVPYMTG